MLLTSVFSGTPQWVLTQLNTYLKERGISAGLVHQIKMVDGRARNAITSVTLILQHHHMENPMENPENGCMVHHVLTYGASAAHRELEEGQNQVHTLNQDPADGMQITGQDLLTLYDDSGAKDGFFWVAITAAPRTK